MFAEGRLECRKKQGKEGDVNLNLALPPVSQILINIILLKEVNYILFLLINLLASKSVNCNEIHIDYIAYAYLEPAEKLFCLKFLYINR